MFKLKAKVLLSTMVVGALSISNLSAQDQNGRPGGLFGTNSSGISNGLIGRSENTARGCFIGQGFGATGAEITGQTFGAPLGSELLILIATSAGYAIIRSRKRKTKRKNEHEKD